MKIAIVGGGISGLTAAYRLHPDHDITLFEANQHLGGHTNTVDVDTDAGKIPIDTGFIVFNDRTYPHFSHLLEQLRVQAMPTTMGFSVRCDQSGLEYCGSDFRSLFAQRTNLFRPRFHRMLWDIVCFNRFMMAKVDELDESLTVGEFLRRRRYGKMFIEQHFLPMAAAVWSCPRDTIENFPMKFIGEFYRNHGLLGLTDRPQWYVVRGGSRTYVEAMSRHFHDRVHLACPVTSLERTEAGVHVTTQRFGRTRFDYVVMACHSDQALRILGEDASRTERAVLGQFPYECNLAILHTDTSVLPRRRRAWASWNYLIQHLPPKKIDAAADEHGDGTAALQNHSPASKVTVTYNMNMLQHIQSEQTYCVSLNCEADICPQQVLRKITYDHPIFTSRRNETQRRHQELLNHRRTSYCGAYWGNGFHEDGVVSGLRVCEAIAEFSRDRAAPRDAIGGPSFPPALRTPLREVE